MKKANAFFMGSPGRGCEKPRSDRIQNEWQTDKIMQIIVLWPIASNPGTVDAKRLPPAAEKRRNCGILAHLLPYPEQP